MEHTNQSVTLSLENHGEKAIHVFHKRATPPTSLSLVVYELQVRVGDEFRRHGEVPHLANDNLNIVEPRSSVSFQVNLEGLSKGEYRVRVGYGDDPALYDLYRTKWPDFSDEDFRRFLKAGRSVVSETFTVL
jgi:hypothetical protein